MAQVIVNPEELLAFANELNQYVSSLEESTQKIDSQFKHLSETWKDQKQQSFSEKFEQIRASIINFKNEANEQIPYIRSLAEDANNYLRR